MSVCKNYKIHKDVCRCLTKDEEISLDDITKIIITLNNRITKLRDEIATIRRVNFNSDLEFENRREKCFAFIPSNHLEFERRKQIVSEEKDSREYILSSQWNNQGESTVKNQYIDKIISDDSNLTRLHARSMDHNSQRHPCCKNCVCKQFAEKNTKKFSRGVQYDIKIEGKRRSGCLKCLAIKSSSNKHDVSTTIISNAENNPPEKSDRINYESLKNTNLPKKSKWWKFFKMTHCTSRNRSTRHRKKSIRKSGKKSTGTFIQEMKLDSAYEQQNDNLYNSIDRKSKENSESIKQNGKGRKNREQMCTVGDRMGGGGGQERNPTSAEWSASLNKVLQNKTLTLNTSKIKSQLTTYIVELNDRIKELTTNFYNMISTEDSVKPYCRT